MRLNSNFADYYDAMAAASPHDDGLTYHRFSKKLGDDSEISNFHKPIEFKYGRGLSSWSADSMVRFCQNGYYDKNAWEVSRAQYVGIGNIIIPVIEITCNNLKRYLAFEKSELQVIADKLGISSYARRDYNRHVDGLFDDIESLRKIVGTRFGPVWIVNFVTRRNHTRNDLLYYSQVEVTKNPCLRDLSINKILAPHIAWNEIYRYHCINGDDPAVPEMPNDIKIEQHGFDLKTSFRKAKQNVEKK